jgi:hypothetical protein
MASIFFMAPPLFCIRRKSSQSREPVLPSLRGESSGAIAVLVPASAAAKKRLDFIRLSAAAQRISDLSAI